MKYKVGDKVRIRKDLEVGKLYGSCFFEEEMQNLAGKIARITEVNKRDYCIASCDYYWTDEMFENDEDTKVQTMKHKVGDKVRIRKDLERGWNYGNYCVVPQMQNLGGKITRIAKVFKEDGCYRIDSCSYNWTDEMFEDAGTEVHEMNKHVVIDVDGNKVVARCDNKEGIARCHPDDDFGFYIGAKLALERLEKAEKPYGWLRDGVIYFVPDVCRKELYDGCMYVADDCDKRAIRRGIAFKTEEEAIACAKKMLVAIKKEA